MSQSLSFDRVADRYDATRGYPPDVARQIAGGLIRLAQLAPHARVLELGIGTGRIALPLLARGIDITGVDIAPLMLERLQAKYADAQQADAQHEDARQAEPSRPPASWGVLSVQLADMTALPFPDHSFDAVVAVHVLHLVPGWRTALDEALRVIRPGGSFLLGQDITATDAVNHQIQDHWLRIVREMGANTTRIGASGYTEIREALRARGLAPQESILASWTHIQTPREVVRYIADRTWSQTWSIPDRIFTESMHRLESWVSAHYGGALDTPLPARLSFKVAYATV